VIKKLSVSKRMLIVERTLKTIREGENKKSLAKAVDSLLDEYRNNIELTSLTKLDYEVFYESNHQRQIAIKSAPCPKSGS